MKEGLGPLSILFQNISEEGTWRRNVSLREGKRGFDLGVTTENRRECADLHVHTYMQGKLGAWPLEKALLAIDLMLGIDHSWGGGVECCPRSSLVSLAIYFTRFLYPLSHEVAR